MNPLIYGKNDTKRIVSIEIIDDQAELFIQNDNREVVSTIVPNKFWILSNEPHDRGWVKLKGDLHYKWGKAYTSAGKFYSDKKELKSSEVDIYCINDPKESFLVKYGYTYFKDLHPKDINILSFDIETTGLNHDENSKILIISNTYRNGSTIIRKLFSYDEYESQAALLSAWCDWVRSVDPTLIVGHNIYTYDLPYMQYIASNEGIELILGRNDSPLSFASYDSMKRIDGSRKQAYRKCKIYGREIIDTMFLAINYDISKKYESYALKKIIAQEGLEVKDRQFYDASKIRDNYTIPEEWEKIKQYALHDADDALALFDLMSPAYFYLAQSVPKSFQGIVDSASGSQINAMMVRSYIQNNHSIPKATNTFDYEGAISFGNPGIYRNAFKVDVASLYPSLMIYHEVYDEVKDPLGNMLSMVKTFTAERLSNKKKAKETGIKYYDDMQNAQKIVINSFYGFLGAEGLNFNSPKNAAFITKAGREVLNLALEWSIDKGCKIVNADTDSITFCLSDMGFIEESTRKTLLQEINDMYPDRIKFEDDGFYNVIIVLKAKNYILFDGKKIKIKGSALKDAKKERALKEFMMKVIESMIHDKNHYSEIYHEYVKEALNIKDISRWASKKTISSKVLKNERTNEVKIRDAIQDQEIVEGDKVYLYYKSDDSLALADKFDGDYNKTRLLEKLYKTSMTFSSVIPKETFINYSLKRSQKLLEDL